MRIRTLVLLIVMIAISAFAAINWSAFVTPTALSFGVATVQAPLGLVMLFLLAFVSSLFLVFVVYMQTAVFFDTRRHLRELQANRDLAQLAEASRFSELRLFLEEELKKQAEQDTEASAIVLARIDQLDQDIRAAIEQSENTLNAYIGELEDRLERTSPGSTLPPLV